ncbi:MAG TPA: DUF2017 domain-containing protein [Pseudonocardiaceae bacterium]
MEAWRRDGDHVVAVLPQHEALLVRALVTQIKDMLQERAASAPRDELAALTGIRTGHTTAPEDPILARLLPDYHRLDGADGAEGNTAELADSAAALRSLREPELIDHKTGVAGVVLRTCSPEGGTIRLTLEEAEAWLSALNDVRLAFGVALDITEDTPDVLPPDDPRAPQLELYHWLTWMQERLVQALWGGDDELP